MNLWFLCGCVAAVAYGVIQATKAALSLGYFRRHPESDLVEGSVTILQPILGGDPALEQTLQANLQNASGGTQFLWLVDDDDLIGREVAERLLEQTPRLVRVVRCPACGEGMNPKSFKLHLALPEVTTEFMAVLDDDTILSPGHLQRGIATLASCDLYTGLPRYASNGGLWSDLVAHFVNNNSITTYLSLLDAIGPLTINGMFYVMRTETLRRMGGFESIVGQLCDDYALAQLVKRHDGKIRQGVTSQLLQTSIAGPRQYARQMHRWFLFANVLVQDQTLQTQLLLVTLLGLPPLLLWLSFLSLAGGMPGGIVLLAILVGRHLMLRQMHRRVFGGPMSFSWSLSLLAELLQPFHLLHACLSPVIVWRSRRIRVGRRGSFSYVVERRR